MKRLFLAALLALAAALPASSPAQPAEQVLRTRVIVATMLGWERGDYVWAQLDTGRRRFSAMPGDDPIGPFLEAYRGRRLHLWVETVRTTLPEAGRTEIRRIVRARFGGLTADRWWNRLSPAYRRAYRRRYEEAIG